MKHEMHPEEGLWFIQKVFVFWIFPLIKLAHERMLQPEDVHDCPSDQNIEHDSKIVWDAWLEEKRRCGSKATLSSAIFRGFQSELIFSGVLQITFCFTQIAQPYLVGELVAYVSSGAGGKQYAIGICFALAALSLASSLSFSACFFVLRRLGVAVRSGVSMGVYFHTLRLTSASRMKMTVGATTSLAAIDSEKLFLGVQFFHFLWHGPLASLVVMLLLIREVGYAPALAGLAWVLVLIPLQNVIANRIGNHRRGMVQYTDERSKLTNEALGAIRAIKLYGWEIPIANRALSVRAKEVKLLSSYLNVNALLRELLFAAGPISTLIIFGTAIYAMNDSITVVQFFRVLAFINVLRFPLNLLGQALKNAFDAAVSIQRLNRFFLLPTLPGLDVLEEQNASSTSPAPSPPRICIENCDFAWSAEEDGSASQGCFTLKNIHLMAEGGGDGQLIAIVGNVGSGKSTCLSSILNELPQTSGPSFSVTGKIAFCAQTPWIQNMTLRENVLFGASSSDKDDSLLTTAYEEAVEAAALLPDIAILPNGSDCEIGERGINLSGGQKARVSIARALMASKSQGANIILLDDPFSAVDGNTGNTIFHKGIVQMLKGTLRVVALNSHMHLLPHFDRILVLDQGRVIADGSCRVLVESQGELMAKITGMSHEQLLSSSSFGGTTSPPQVPINSSSSSSSAAAAAEASTTTTTIIVEEENKKEEKKLEEENEPEEHGETNGEKHSPLPPPPPSLPSVSISSKPLIEVEKRASGAVTYETYLTYFGAAFWPKAPLTDTTIYTKDLQKVDAQSLRWRRVYGVFVLFFLLLFFTSAQLARLAVDYYLASWARNDGGNQHSKWRFYYFISLIIMSFLLIVRSLYLNYFACASSTRIHEVMMARIFQAPVSTFFDTHTVGEVLNKLTKDTETVDANVPEFFLQLVINWWQVASIFALCVWSSPWLLILLAALSTFFYQLFVLFTSASRDLKRLESVSRSPIYASLSETLTGLETIRAYTHTDRFERTHRKRMETNQKYYFSLWMAMSWMTIRLEIATSIILLAVSLLSVCTRDGSGAGGEAAIGLALSYGLQLTALFQRCIQLSIDVGVYMLSTERVLEYLEIPQEKSIVCVGGDDGDDGGGIGVAMAVTSPSSSHIYTPVEAAENGLSVSSPPPPPQALKSAPAAEAKSFSSSVPSAAFPASWPSSGAICFDKCVMRYRDNEPVLKGVSFSSRGGERLGVCGRTGAGKSSLMVCLFRIVELEEGSIRIDGFNIAQVPLAILRSRLAIIPQDPVLFTGDVRFQIDPFERHEDHEIWDVLEQVAMSETVKAMPRGLREEIVEHGDNLSHGQRQLLCIARALLRKAKVLVVDEGTSAVDMHTDFLIQNALRVAASKHGATVLAIAHRLQTILDYDKILVMSEGRVLEFDTPQALLAREDSSFAAMMKEGHGKTH